jgi:hypothetical protein
MQDASKNAISKTKSDTNMYEVKEMMIIPTSWHSPVWIGRLDWMTI